MFICVHKFFNEIENTKKTGNLFSNENNLDVDNLSLLSFNFSQSLKKINSINNLIKDKIPKKRKFYVSFVISKVAPHYFLYLNSKYCI